MLLERPPTEAGGRAPVSGSLADALAPTAENPESGRGAEVDALATRQVQEAVVRQGRADTAVACARPR